MTELVHQVDLDFATDAESLEQAEEHVTAWLNDIGVGAEPVTAEVVEMYGPAGGNPVVRFRTPSWGVMMRLLYDYCNFDLADAISYYDENVKITL